MRFPELELLYEIQAHTSNVYCLDFDPKGRYFALGGADALSSIWDLEQLYCIRTFGKLEFVLERSSHSWPIRTLGLSFDGEYIATGSEENSIDIVCF